MGKTQILNRAFETIALGLLFVWWGLRWWPFQALPNGSGLLGTGVILLGLNVARIWFGIPAQKHITTLAALVLGIGGSLLACEALNIQFEIPLFEAALIALGIILLIREFVHWRKMDSQI